MKQVAKVGIFYNNKYLMGIRRDSGKWTEPGGHLEGNETPRQGAAREVLEETGIKIPQGNLTHLGDKEVAKPDGTSLRVYAYRADLKKEEQTTTEKDPDKEVFGWNWIPVEKNKLPESVEKNLSVPAKDNVLHFFLGFEKKSFDNCKWHNK